MAKGYDSIIQYKLSANLKEPLHIGSSEGDNGEILTHPVDEKPFIQATSLAGIFRSAYRDMGGNDDDWFGKSKLEEGSNSSEFSSKISFTDGIFNESPRIELRPRVAINPETGSVSSAVIRGTDNRSGQKFEMECIGAGANFDFTVVLKCNENEIDGYVSDLNQLLSYIQYTDTSAGVQFGGQKSNGCGFITFDSIKRKIYKLKEEQDLNQWLSCNIFDDKGLSEVTLEGADNSFGYKYEVDIIGKTEGGLLVKAICVPDVGEDAPDAINIQNAKMDYIIPGSSVKGAFRSRMTQIATYLKMDQLIADTFGQKGEKNRNSKAGNIVFLDSIVGQREENDAAPLTHRIHIDKFTGGVINGGKFSEKDVSGDITIRIRIKHDQNADKSFGLLMFAVRDFANHQFNLGSGYATGKGYVDVKNIKVRSLGKETTIDLNALSDEAKILLKQGMDALKEDRIS